MEGEVSCETLEPVYRTIRNHTARETDVNKNIAFSAQWYSALRGHYIWRNEEIEAREAHPSKMWSRSGSTGPQSHSISYSSIHEF